MSTTNLESVKVRRENTVNETSLPPINPKKCTTTCKCMSLREAYYCPIRIAGTFGEDNATTDSIRHGWSTREYKEASIERYRIWEDQNIYADMPPLHCNKCKLAETIGGWLYERQSPTLKLCECIKTVSQSIETMTPE